MAETDTLVHFCEHPGVQWAWVMLAINGIPANPESEFDNLLGSDVQPRWLKNLRGLFRTGFSRRYFSLN
jgi:hypothetical protein